MPYKSLKNVLLEIVLFIAMVALTGHVTVNLWERYVVQNELSSMKNSLHHLKITVHNIGDAYDDLQKELIDLARINSKPSIPQNEIYSCKKTRALDQKILQKLQILLMKVNNTSPIETADKMTEGVNTKINSLTINATTLTRLPMKAAAVGSEPINVIKESHEKDMKREYIYSRKTKHTDFSCYNDNESCVCGNTMKCLKL